MIPVKRPSRYLPDALIQQLRASAAEVEQQGFLHPEQLALIYEQQWFNMLVPARYGGGEWPLPNVLHTEEALSYADGSVGWVVTLCSGAGWFVGFLDPHLAAVLFKDPQVCITGSGAMTGMAEEQEYGYEVTGYWKHASGALHATAFTANCVVHKKGAPVYNPDGTPVVRSFLFLKEEVTVHKTWNAMGMIATGSHAFETQQLFVPEDRCFIIDPAKATHPGALYQYPFLQLAETTLAVNLSGMAARFIELCQFEGTRKNSFQNGKGTKLLQQATAAQEQHHALREAFYTTVYASWKALEVDGKIDATLLANVSAHSQRLAHESRTLVNELYPYCGLEAADRSSEMNRVWRNIHTAGQHALFQAGLE